MKKLLTILVLALILTSFTAPESSPFCAGWEDGHCAGYRSIKGDFALCPIAPLCPLPPMGCDYDDYRCGFTAGVLAGARAAQNNPW